MDTTFKKNMLFLMIGLIVSLLVGLYSLFAGIIVLLFVMARFFFEFVYYSFYLKKRPQKEIGIEKTIPFPFLVINNEKIIYYSELFLKRFNLNSDFSLNVNELIPDFQIGVMRQKLNFKGSSFVIFLSAIKFKGEQKSYVAFFIESLYGLDKSISGAKPVVTSLIFIDNYEEVYEHLDEIKKPLLSALIDRKISTVSNQVGGIYNKIEKDKYLFLMQQDKLDFLKEEKFDILDKVRQIDIGNKMPVTLSIGIGICEQSLAKSMEFARQSIDLALGRGGDQVVIKDSQKFYFYGGKTKEFDSNTRVRARVKAYALTELINESSDVIIMGHANPDLDCLGSAIGISAIANAFGKKSKIIMNNITTSINILYNRLSNDERYKKIFVNTSKALDTITTNSLLIIVDTHRPNLLESQEVLLKTKKIVVFDHHRKSAEFINNTILNYHEPYASSTCELITEMLYYIKRQINLLPVEADALLAGITVDTKNFAFKTGAKTFEAAAYLRRCGADSIRVRLLFQYKMEAYKAKALAVNNAEIYNDNMAIAVCPPNLENPSLISSKAADDLLNIFGIVASFVLSEAGDKILISARSIGDINVQIIMEKLGGGGHQTVAGAQLTGLTIDEVIENLKEAIDQYILEVKK